MAALPLELKHYKMAEDSDEDADMADCITFFHTVKRRKFMDGDFQWTTVSKFDPPLDYRVRGRVLHERECWRVHLIPLTDPNFKQPACSVRFQWTLSVVKGQTSMLNGSRIIIWEESQRDLDNTDGDCDSLDSIEVKHHDIERNQIVGGDGSITFMWFVKLFLDHSLTKGISGDREMKAEANKPDISDQGLNGSPQILAVTPNTKEHTAEREKLTAEIEKLRTTTLEEHTAKREFLTLTAETEKQKTTIEQERLRVTQLQEDKEGLTQKLNNTTERHTTERESLTAEIDKLKTAFEKQTHQVTELQEEKDGFMRNLKVARENHSAERERLTAELEKLRTIVETRTTETATLTAVVDRQRNIIEGLALDYETLLAQMQSSSQKLKQKPDIHALLTETRDDSSAPYIIQDEEIVKKIRTIFVSTVIPMNVLHIIHHYNTNVLVQQDIDVITSVTSNYGKFQGAAELLSRLVRYKDWFPTLLQVLRDPRIKQSHVADAMEIAVQDSVTTTAATTPKTVHTANPGATSSLEIATDSCITTTTSATSTPTLTTPNITSTTTTSTTITPRPELTTQCDVNLLLAGPTGVGKSATGNSILNLKWDPFLADDGTDPVTQTCQFEYSRYLGRTIKVVDMPGHSYSSRNKAEDNHELLTAFCETPDGYDAVLVVVRFDRQSNAQRKTIQILRDIFGTNFVREYGILVVTHGDFFKRSYQTQTFDEYLPQNHILNELCKECDKRVVLFDNVTDKVEEKEAQRKQLFDLVDTMRGKRRYTPDVVNAANAKRDELIAKSEDLVFTNTMKSKLLLMIHDLRDFNFGTPDEDMSRLDEIKMRAQEFQAWAQGQDRKGNKIMKAALAMAESIEKVSERKMELASLMTSMPDKTASGDESVRKTKKTLESLKTDVGRDEAKLQKQYDLLLEPKTLQMCTVQ